MRPHDGYTMTTTTLIMLAVLLPILAGAVCRVHVIAQRALVRAVQAEQLAISAHIRIDMLDDDPQPPSSPPPNPTADCAPQRPVTLRLATGAALHQSSHTP
jgi:hypothetical protein